MGVGAIWALSGLVFMGLGVLLSVLIFRDARRRGFKDSGALLIAVVTFLSIPVGPLVYLVASALGALDRDSEGVSNSAEA